jgi:hypothetical protein
MIAALTEGMCWESLKVFLNIKLTYHDTSPLHSSFEYIERTRPELEVTDSDKHISLQHSSSECIETIH